MTTVTNAADVSPDTMEWIFRNVDALIDSNINLITPSEHVSYRDLIYAAYVGFPCSQGLFAIGDSPAAAFDELAGVCYGVCPKFRIEDSDASIVEIPTEMYLAHYKVRRGPFAASLRRDFINGEWRAD